jgi:predicted lipid-binding transport protein (Tim44 family)
MSASGRDRDPGYRKGGRPKGPARPASASQPETPKETPNEETPSSKPEATPSEPVQPSESQETPKPASTVDTDKRTDVIKEHLGTPEVTTKADPGPPPPSDPPKKKKDTGGSSRGRKMIGVILALVLLVGMIAGVMFVIQNISEKEAEKANSEMGVPDAEENETSADDMAEPSESNDSSSAQTGTLSDENNFESELKEAHGDVDSEPSEAAERAALKSKIIRKKGDFEVPSWIIAFSANSKKPLANINYSTLEALGYDAGIYWIPKYFPDSRELYKVYVGPYGSESEANQALPAIQQIQPDAYVMKIDE